MVGMPDKDAAAKADRALQLHEQGLTRAQLAERLCVNPKNMTGMLQRARQRREKAGAGVVEGAARRLSGK
jgi:DNA-binding transcriptional regulator LsrR (DeoR family)